MNPGVVVAVVLSIIAVSIVLLLITRIRIVRQTQKIIVERLGAYHATWSVGFHFLWPFIDRIAKNVSMKEQVNDFPPQPVITKDNVTMQIDTIVFFQITDPKLYSYGVENPDAALESLTSTTLRNIIGELDLDETLTSRDIINTKMRSILDEATDPWGIKVIKAFSFPPRNTPSRPPRKRARRRCIFPQARLPSRNGNVNARG